MILFFVKLIVAVSCITVTLGYLVMALVKKNKVYAKVEAITFFSTVGAIVLLSVGEFVFRATEKDYPEKDTTLFAIREASLGAIHLRIYTDSTYALGNSVAVNMKGTARLYGDTLFLFRSDSIAKSFIIKQDHLVEITNTGIRFLEMKSL